MHFSISFRFEVYRNLCIERPVGVDNGNLLSICISEHMEKVNSIGREEVVVIAVSVGQVDDAETETADFTTASGKLLANSLPWCCWLLLDREKWDISCDSGNFLCSLKAAEACFGLHSSSEFFQCLLPYSKYFLPKVTSCLP